MNENDLEGTLVLEKLASIGMVEEFFDAVDADDFEQAKQLMQEADVDPDTITIVLKKMSETSGEH